MLSLIASGYHHVSPTVSSVERSSERGGHVLAMTAWNRSRGFPSLHAAGLANVRGGLSHVDRCREMTVG